VALLSDEDVRVGFDLDWHDGAAPVWIARLSQVVGTYAMLAASATMRDAA
jgi:hypothetical protein